MATSGWDSGDPGVVQLPSGRRVRGRALRRPLPPGPLPEFAVYLRGRAPAPTHWDARWIRWPDFWLPLDRRDAQKTLQEAWLRAPSERVEIGCGGGRGRTGTALACLAVLDGLAADQALAFIRDRFDPRAVETPWQSRYVARFGQEN
jgi:hypothetical protein